MNLPAEFLLFIFGVIVFITGFIGVIRLPSENNLRSKSLDELLDMLRKKEYQSYIGLGIMLVSLIITFIRHI